MTFSCREELDDPRLGWWYAGDDIVLHYVLSDNCSQRDRISCIDRRVRDRHASRKPHDEPFMTSKANLLATELVVPVQGG